MRARPWFAALAFLIACGRPPPPDRPPVEVRGATSPEVSLPPAHEAPLLPPLAAAPTTVERRLRLSHPRVSPEPDRNPGLVSVRNQLEAEGWGELLEAPGEPHKARALGGRPPPPGPSARRLTRFVHLTDVHIADDESPARAAAHDSPGPAAGALRPQEAELCRLLSAAVRTINALDHKDPIDFVLMGGDNIDNAQSNELTWMLGVLSGSPQMVCDSGEKDDPVPGGNNDGKDPFATEGLKVPWKWVTGNHDVLVQGTVEIDIARQAVTGSFAPGGTRDYARGGEVFRGAFVTPDARRVMLDRHELLARVQADGDGHGLGPHEVEGGRAFYSFDAGPARFVVLDTAAETGGTAGLLRRDDADRFLAPTLEAAAQGEHPVLLVAHHPYDGLVQDGGRFGRVHPDALLPPDFAQLAGKTGAVGFSLVGHAHRHRVRPVQPSKGKPFWEITTSSLADFPHQLRVLELYDQDNGWLMLRSTVVDVAVDSDPVAQKGRERGAIDHVAGYAAGGPGSPDDRNVELWVQARR